MNYKDAKRGLPQRDSKVFAVINQKGGIGKKQTSINLAVCLSRKGYKVVLRDGNTGSMQ